MDQKIRRFGFGAENVSTEALARGSCARQSSPRNRIKKTKKYNKKIGYTNNRGKIRAVMGSMQTQKICILTQLADFCTHTTTPSPASNNVEQSFNWFKSVRAMRDVFNIV